MRLFFYRFMAIHMLGDRERDRERESGWRDREIERKIERQREKLGQR